MADYYKSINGGSSQNLSPTKLPVSNFSKVRSHFDIHENNLFNLTSITGKASMLPNTNGPFFEVNSTNFHPNLPNDREINNNRIKCSSSVIAHPWNDDSTVTNPFYLPSINVDVLLNQRLNPSKNNGHNNSFHTPCAHADETLNCPEVLFHWISMEERYLPSSTYFNCVQSEIQPYMRKTLVTWMYEVCEELQRRKDVFHLAVNYLDRFLSSLNTPKCYLQLLGSACMLLASKFKEAHPLSTEILIMYTDNSITLSDLLKWEILLTNVINWDISAPTSCLILDLLLQTHPIFKPMNPELVDAILKTSQFFLDKCSLEYQYLGYPPSMMASACLSIAYIMFSYQYNSNFDETQLYHFLDKITQLTNIETDVLRNLIPVIGNYLESFYRINEQNRPVDLCANYENDTHLNALNLPLTPPGSERRPSTSTVIGREGSGNECTPISSDPASQTAASFYLNLLTSRNEVALPEDLLTPESPIKNMEINCFEGEITPSNDPEGLGYCLTNYFNERTKKALLMRRQHAKDLLEDQLYPTPPPLQ